MPPAYVGQAEQAANRVWYFSPIELVIALTSLFLCRWRTKNGTVYGRKAFNMVRKPGRWFTTVFQWEYDRGRTIYNAKTAEIRRAYGRKSSIGFTVEYDENTAVYSQIPRENGRYVEDTVIYRGP